MKKKNHKSIYLGIIALLAVLAVGTFAFGYSGPAPKVVVEGDYIEGQTNGGDTLGAMVGPDIYNNLYVHGQLIKGGGVYNATSTLVTAFTLTAAEVCNNSLIHVNYGAAATTHMADASINITLPATTTLYSDCLREPGDEITFFFKNNSPTAATTTEIVAGTGCEAMLAKNGGGDEIPGLEGARVTILRADNNAVDVSNATCIVLVEEMVVD